MNERRKKRVFRVLSGRSDEAGMRPGDFRKYARTTKAGLHARILRRFRGETKEEE